MQTGKGITWCKGTPGQEEVAAVAEARGGRGEGGPPHGPVSEISCMASEEHMGLKNAGAARRGDGATGGGQEVGAHRSRGGRRHP